MIVASHLAPLEGTTWSVWRDVALRSAGFPADMLLAICDEALARSADLDGQPDAGQPPYDAAYADAISRLSLAMTEIAANPAFREAVTWQNPALADRVLDSDLGAARLAKYRKREIVITSYLQRYCLKNDTIGFFGPVGWARVTPAAAGLDVRPGERLLARRTTHFEVWAIDKVAEAIARQGRMLGWLRPRRNPLAYVAGNVLHRPHGLPVTLTDAELRILRACDGSRTISEVTASAEAPDGRALLTRLARLGALRLDLEGPMHSWPEQLLRDKLEQIADPAARAAALAPLERMTKAREAVAATAGDAASLRKALAGLDETFEEVTGSPATRRAGATYAGRTLVYTDAVRDVRVQIGAAVTQALARPLGLVLDSARWLVNDITAQYRKLFAALFDDENARAGGADVPLSRLLVIASPYLVTASMRTPTEIAAARVAEFQRRWQAVLDVPASARRHQVRAEVIAARVAELFPGQPAAWSSARQHSPDVMIAAASPDAVRRGEFLLVLGELHLAHNTLEGRCFAEQHPDPARLIAAESADHGARRIAVIPAKDSPLVTSRTSPPSALLPPDQVYWSVALSGAVDPPQPATVMPAAELLVRRRGDDLVVRRASSGAELDFFEVIGDIMNSVLGNAFLPVAPARHQPRITIDRLVLSRERWVLEVARSQWAFVKDEQSRFLQARRWRAKYHLPERAFFRVPVEDKPIAVDFRSIALVNLFAKLIRQTKTDGGTSYSVTEMLPDVDQLWLHDRAGRRYSSEFRFVAYDGMPGNPEGAGRSGRTPRLQLLRHHGPSTTQSYAMTCRKEKSMPTVRGALRSIAMAPALADVTFAKRGFPAEPSAATELLEAVPQSVICGFEWGIEARNQWEVERRLSFVNPELRGFAYEGATMAYTILDTMGKGHRTRDLLLGPGRPHIFLAYIGMGFAMARLPRPIWKKVLPDLTGCEFHPTMSWLVVDGYGFDRAYFDTKRWVDAQRTPAPYPWEGSPDYFLRAVDQGIGRALWFICGANVPGVVAAVGRFASHRHADLWSGVGLAAAFAGGSDAEGLAALRRSAGEYWTELALGTVFAIKARTYAGFLPPHTELTCSALADLSAEAAVALADSTSPDGADGEVPAYEVWRRNIRSRLAAR